MRYIGALLSMKGPTDEVWKTRAGDASVTTDKLKKVDALLRGM